MADATRGGFPEPDRATGLWRLRLSRRRWLVFGLCVGLMSLVCLLLNLRVFRGGLDPIDFLACAIYLLLMFSGLFNLLLYVFGFFLLRAIERARGGDSGNPLLTPSESSEADRGVEGIAPGSDPMARGTMRRPAAPVRPATVTTRTAIVMPIYHEDTGRVALGVRHTWRSVKRAGLDQHRDFYLLSDSTDPAIREQEEAMYQRLLAEFDGNRHDSGRLFLLRRRDRKNFKAGNIAHFYLHGRFVLEILTGRGVAWGSQSRNPGERLSWSTATPLFWLPALAGMVWLPAVMLFTPSFLIFLIPMVTGWLLSIPLAVISSDARLGTWLARRGLFVSRFGEGESDELGGWTVSETQTRAEPEREVSESALP